MAGSFDFDYHAAAEVVEAILKKAAPLVDEAEVYLGISESLSADLKRDKISIGSNSSGSAVSIRVIKDGKIGVSSTDSTMFWEKCLSAAISSAHLSDTQPWGGLPSGTHEKEGNLSFDSSLTPDSALLGDLIDRMRSGAESEPGAVITGGGASFSSRYSVLANTNGLYNTNKSTTASIMLEAIADQSTGYESDSQYQLSALDPERVGETAAWFCVHGQNGEEVKTGSYDIVLAPEAFSSLLEATLIPALSGRSVHMNRSVFVGKMNEMVAPEQLSLYDHGMDTRSIFRCPWDGEGTSISHLPLIEKGKLVSYYYDLKSAYLFGEKTTGNAVRYGANSLSSGLHNVVFEGPTMDVMDEKCIYARDVVGAHTANPMTGDFSVELSSPFFAEGGALQRPIKTAMLSGNVFDMLHALVGCSKESRIFPRMIIPSVRCAGMSVIGRG
ncbi:MAG: TldD/PmbA family protein [Methanomicrobiales archaeon]|jgi:PmbA protein|nr:TldD/PmbA family protein [Methanomicrobiales archaeon]